MRTAATRVEHEDLAVADFFRARRARDGFDGAVGERVGHGDLDLGLGQEIDLVFGAAVDLGMALLTPEAAHVADRHALHAELGERGAHVVQAKWLDDGDDIFHVTLPRRSWRALL